MNNTQKLPSIKNSKIVNSTFFNDKFKLQAIMPFIPD